MRRSHPSYINNLIFKDMNVVKKENKAVSLSVTEGLTVQIIPNQHHEFLMTTKEVALGYGSSEYSVRQALSRNSSEFQEEKHYLSNVTICHTASKGSSRTTMWTKRGIVRLGFFIKSKNARLFRDWAEDLIINKLGEQTTLFDVPQKSIGKRNYNGNRLTPNRMIDILHDVCKIEDTQLRATISNKLKGGANG